ncbi:hypothetical protein PVAP13_2KG264364 [Panicum virgatum]|uniref:Uncharacterized protein n=1 Tax=Panicum virgatum TaxID=38727 RepID=A0A8T0WDC1_PANVG|nr:hypothetical protein PVAP13_2KG264364 [Panicum virgatum]
MLRSERPNGAKISDAFSTIRFPSSSLSTHSHPQNSLALPLSYALRPPPGSSAGRALRPRAAHRGRHRRPLLHAQAPPPPLPRGPARPRSGAPPVVTFPATQAPPRGGGGAAAVREVRSAGARRPAGGGGAAAIGANGGRRGHALSALKPIAATPPKPVAVQLSSSLKPIALSRCCKHDFCHVAVVILWCCSHDLCFLIDF